MNYELIVIYKIDGQLYRFKNNYTTKCGALRQALSIHSQNEIIDVKINKKYNFFLLFN